MDATSQRMATDGFSTEFEDFKGNCPSQQVFLKWTSTSFGASSGFRERSHQLQLDLRTTGKLCAECGQKRSKSVGNRTVMGFDGFIWPKFGFMKSTVQLVQLPGRFRFSRDKRHGRPAGGTWRSCRMMVSPQAVDWHSKMEKNF